MAFFGIICLRGMLMFIKKVTNYFDNWNNFEKCFLVVGLIITIFTSIIFNGSVINTLYAIFYFITCLLIAKGKVECFYFGIISAILYIFISCGQGYYGELIITLFSTFPALIVGFISWIKHIDNENVIVVSTLSKKEILISILSQIILFWIYYYILKSINTSELFISSLSIMFSFLGVYYGIRRCKFSMYCFVIDDLVAICMWFIPLINGQIGLFSVFICQILLLISDIYGVYNWEIIKQRQKGKK